MRGSASYHLVLAGSGHAHLPLIWAARQFKALGVELTVIDPAPGLIYSGSLAAVAGRRIAPPAAVIPVRNIAEAQGARFLETTVARIDPGRREVILADGTAVYWDVLSCATGSQTMIPPVLEGCLNPRIVPVKPIRDLAGIRCLVEPVGLSGPVSIALLGGGATAVELAGNLAHAGRHSAPEITIFVRGDHLLPHFPPSAGSYATDHLERMGIHLQFAKELLAVQDGVLQFTDGTEARVDLVIPAIGLLPPPLFRDSGLPVTATGELVVDASLRVPGTAIFGGGDCIAPGGAVLSKTGVHAVRQAPVLKQNILCYLRDGAGTTGNMRTFVPQKKVLQILNLGDGTALAVRGERVLTGPLWLWMKERIDWRYVATGGRRLGPSLLPPPNGSTGGGCG